MVETFLTWRARCRSSSSCCSIDSTDATSGIAIALAEGLVSPGASASSDSRLVHSSWKKDTSTFVAAVIHLSRSDVGAQN